MFFDQPTTQLYTDNCIPISALYDVECPCSGAEDDIKRELASKHGIFVTEDDLLLKLFEELRGGDRTRVSTAYELWACAERMIQAPGLVRLLQREEPETVCYNHSRSER